MPIRIQRIEQTAEELKTEPLREEWATVSMYECHPDLSDMAWHFRGYVIVEWQDWMDARPDIYVRVELPDEVWKVRVRESFVDQVDWARARNEVVREQQRYKPRYRRWPYTRF